MKIFSRVIFLLFFILSVFPLLWLFYSSLKSNTEIIKAPLSLPRDLYLQNYVDAWVKGRLGNYVVNSILYTACSVLFVCIFASMISYIFAKFPTKANKLCYFLFLTSVLIPLQAIIIPLFLLEQKIGLQGSRLGIVIPYITINLPVAIYLVTAFMKGLPDSIIESGRMEGASEWRIFASLIMPLTQPIIVTVVILTILATWNEFLLNFILSGESTRSLPVGINSFAGVQNSNYSLQFASLSINIIPLFILYAIFKDKITKGVIAGSNK